MNAILNGILFAILVYVVVDFVRSYRAAAGTVWQRLLASGKESATIVWQRFTIVVASLADAVVWVADLLNAPSVAEPIKSALQPQYVAAFMVAVAIIGEFARRRTLAG
jgi:hypothetical protein